MNLAEFAGAVRAVADRAEASLALEACRMAAREYLAVLHEVTPVETGALRGSEVIRGISGGGTRAVAVAGPDIIYDKFRNDGGTIHSKGPWSLRRGDIYFGRSVTQRGSHYMERARAEAGPVVAQACKVAADEMFTL